MMFSETWVKHIESQMQIDVQKKVSKINFEVFSPLNLHNRLLIIRANYNFAHNCYLNLSQNNYL